MVPERDLHAVVGNSTRHLQPQRLFPHWIRRLILQKREREREREREGEGEERRDLHNR
jgi:hypothetical protein